MNSIRWRFSKIYLVRQEGTWNVTTTLMKTVTTSNISVFQLRFNWKSDQLCQSFLLFSKQGLQFTINIIIQFVAHARFFPTKKVVAQALQFIINIIIFPTKKLWHTHVSFYKKKYGTRTFLFLTKKSLANALCKICENVKRFLILR